MPRHCSPSTRWWTPSVRSKPGSTPARPGDARNPRMPTLRPLMDAARNAPRLAGRGLIQAYRHTFSALVGFHCRHLPTCSQYADEAIGRFGLWAGGWMTLARLCRCHPFGTQGLDVVPMTLDPGARWFMPWRYGRWRGVNAPPATPGVS